MRKWWHERKGHRVSWKFYPPIWTAGQPRHWICSCGKEWWA